MGKPRDEPLNGETFYSLKEAKFVIKQWRKHYHTIKPHAAKGHRPFNRLYATYKISVRPMPSESG